MDTGTAKTFENDALCENCKDVFAGNWKKSSSQNGYGIRYRHHKNITALRRCAKRSRCRLCKLAVSTYTWAGKDDDCTVDFTIIDMPVSGGLVLYLMPATNSWVMNVDIFMDRGEC